MAQLRDLLVTGTSRFLGKVYATQIIANLTGNAETATKLTTSAGSSTQPVYFSDGKPVVCTYTLGKSVPSDAVFTDTKYTHPTYTAKTSGFYKITVDSLGHVSAVTSVTKEDITALGIPGSSIDTHYTSHLYAGVEGGNANTTTDTSNPYLLICDDTTNRNSIQLKAGTNMTISAKNGVITFTSAYTNTWRGIQNNLTSDSTTESLSAYQGKLLANGSARDSSKLPLSGGTLTGPLDIRGTATSQPLKTRNVVGSDGNGTVGELYLQYGANKAIYLGNSGGYNISADGSSYSGNSATATKLKTARTIQTNLTSTSSVSFDGSANVTPGVTGTLAIGNGGTGKTTAQDAANAFINALSTGSSVPVDADYFVSQYAGGGTSSTTYHRRPVSALWSYINSKISSVLGLTSSYYNGSARGLSITKDGNNPCFVPFETLEGLSTSIKNIMTNTDTGNEPRTFFPVYIKNSGTVDTTQFVISDSSFSSKNIIIDFMFCPCIHTSRRTGVFYIDYLSSCTIKNFRLIAQSDYDSTENYLFYISANVMHFTLLDSEILHDITSINMSTTSSINYYFKTIKVYAKNIVIDKCKIHTVVNNTTSRTVGASDVYCIETNGDCMFKLNNSEVVLKYHDSSSYCIGIGKVQSEKGENASSYMYPIFINQILTRSSVIIYSREISNCKIDNVHSGVAYAIYNGGSRDYSSGMYYGFLIINNNFVHGHLYYSAGTSAGETISTYGNTTGPGTGSYYSSGPRYFIPFN